MNGPAVHELIERDKEMIPRVLLRAMLALVLICLAIVAAARLTDRPLEAQFPDMPILEERSIQIFGKMDGSAVVSFADGAPDLVLSAQEGGFVSGMTRALGHERGLSGIAATEPVRLVRYADGRLALIDDLTGWEAQIIGFGKDNTAAFERLMKTPVTRGE
ncbi:photosynthetic complex assembly protein PuhC [Tropicimonas sp. S265A]|uniref:photosynthetic complex assembly protein PuhC n=1 Tax=Tropicimonas sp. S265A TaxID=3415134 RepID=UPI003C7C176F